MREEQTMNKLSVKYLVITFAIMILCWGTCVTCSICGIYLSDNFWLYLPYILGGFSPTIASFIVLKQSGSVKNFKGWLKDIFDFKHKPLTYLMVIVFNIIVILPQCLVSGYEPGAPLYAIFVLVPMMLFGGGLEEAGWRHILQPELEKKFGFTIATIFVSIIWWLWHLPLFFITGISQDGMSYWAFGIGVLGLSFALAAIKNKTNSTWLCILFHSIVNSLPVIFTVNSDIPGNIVASVLLILVAYIIIKVDNKGKFLV